MLAIFALLQLGAAIPADSVEKLRDRARNAEARYERLARSTAPLSWGGGGGNCDEIVGRFCIRFDSLSKPPETTEDVEVTAARRDAIEAVRRFFSAAASDRRAAGPLVRLLVDDDRAREAASAAGAYAALSRDSVWGELLQGYALHAAGDHGVAEQHYTRGIARMDSTTRRRWRDPSWLLDDAEQRAVSRLPAAARAQYETRLWRLSDPFWLTEGNETWLEHVSRHLESALLKDVPFVSGMTSWGEDVYELTVRYGTPTARTRINNSNPLASAGSNFVEYWDSASRSYVPPRLLLEGYPSAPEPGIKPLLYAARARTGYAWRGERVVEIEHQVTRFIDGGAVVLRVDAAVHADTTPSRAPTEATLFTADSLLSALRVARAPLTWQKDSGQVTLVARAPPGHLVYSVEVIDSAAQLAARARYALSAHLPDSAPWLSDILVCAPFPAGAHPARYDDSALAARPSLVLRRGDTLGIYAEAYRLREGESSLEVQLSIEPADPPHAVRRLFDWVGRAAGLAGPPTQPRVAWTEATTAVVHALSVNLPLDPRLRGRHMLVMRITDPVRGASAVSRRLILIED